MAEQDDDLACARGIVNGVLFEAFVAVVVVFAIWMLLL